MNKELTPIDLKKSMLAHIALEEAHSISHKYIVVFPEDYKSMYDLVFYSETTTEKLGFMEYGKSETIYYFKNEKIYKSLKWLLKSKNLKLKTDGK